MRLLLIDASRHLLLPSVNRVANYTHVGIGDDEVAWFAIEAVLRDLL